MSVVFSVVHGTGRSFLRGGVVPMKLPWRGRGGKGRSGGGMGRVVLVVKEVEIVTQVGHVVVFPQLFTVFMVVVMMVLKVMVIRGE